MSDAWYYYFADGKAVGPLDLNTLLARVREGAISPYQLVFRGGEDEWKPALSFNELRKELQKVKPVDRKVAEWVVLKREGGKFSVETEGPFTTDQVRDRLEEGKNRYTDYAWRDGMHHWRRIAVIRDFQADAKPSETPAALFDIGPPDEEVTGKDILLDVDTVVRRAPIPVVEARPPEAEGEDLTKFPLPPPPPSARDRRKKERKAQPVPAPPPVETPPETPKPPQAQPQPTAHEHHGVPALAVIAILLIVAAAMILKFGPRLYSAPVPVLKDLPPKAPPPPEIVSAPPAQPIEVVEEEPEEQAEEEAAPEPPPPVHATKHVKHPPHAVTRLKLKVKSHTGRFASLKIDTDGGPEQILLVEIVGAPGLVVGQSHYYRRWKWSPEKPEITDEDLPAGYFRVHAWAGEVSSEERFESGSGEKRFLENLKAQRKASYADYWSERKRLFAVTKQVARAFARPKIIASEVDKFAAFQPTQFAFFDAWNELREICKSAKKQDIASAREAIAQFQTKVGQLTVWR